MSTRKLKGSTGGCQCCYLIVSFPAVWVLPVDEWNSMKHSQVCVLHNLYTGLSASSSICMWSKTNNRKPHSELYSCVSKNKYCCLLGSVLKVSVLVTLLLLPHKHYVYCLYDMQGSKMSLPRLHVHAHDSFSFCSVFLQVTLLVPQHHTPLHTQRQILQVSRWSAPMWEHESLTTFFFICQTVSKRWHTGRRKETLLAHECLAEPSCLQRPWLCCGKRKMWNFTLSEGLQWTQGSVCRYFWFINVMFVFEGLLNGELVLQADVISSS